tara:strand:- start:11423 stop:12469 length:1047 start_codon:yes stop_codon:yes gene_type:complete
MDKAYYKTLQPLIDSGHMQAAIDGTYKFPGRVNLFPGVSCMFECSFCGRNYQARNPNYNYFYDTLLDQDPKDNPYRYNISGGLEPLTYTEIDRLCKDLYDKGFKSRLVTNGFLLTPINIKRKPNLLTLDHIRVSLYGYNKEQTLQTTKHKKAFDVVKQNLKDYNKLICKPPLHINHVILPTDFENLSDILNYIDDIGGVDTLSLREDFSFQYPINDRNRLMDKLLEFDEQINNRSMKVDYGYALEQLLRGKEAKLLSIDYTQLTEKQSPQIGIAIDPRGDIYSYFEAAFIDRKKSERHILGNVINSSIEEQLKKQIKVKPHKDDVHFLDAFNLVIENYKWMKLQETSQ